MSRSDLDQYKQTLLVWCKCDKHGRTMIYCSTDPLICATETMRLLVYEFI